MLENLSAHLAFSYLNAYHQDYSEPYLLGKDIWFYGRWQPFSFFQVEAGPGQNQTDQFSYVEPKTEVNFDSQYFAANALLQPLSWLDLSSQLRYILSSTQESSSLFATERVPDQDLYQGSSNGQSQGSYSIHSHIGVNKILGGLGFGYHDLLISSNQEGEDGKRRPKIKRQRGLGFSYSASL